ncbi:MAG: hypothetical protein AAB484_00105 [Patescibacteria group bacterium]
MSKEKRIEWILRVAVAGEFLGHGVLAIGQKATWLGWIEQILRVEPTTAVVMLTIIGVLDVALAVLVLVKPVRMIILWMAVWGFITALIRPIVGESVWDFIERFANVGAPLALYYLLKK